MFPTAKNHFCVRYSSLDLWPNVSFEELLSEFPLVPFSAWLRSNGLPDKSTYTEQSQDTPSSSPPSTLSSCVFLTPFFLKEHHSFSSSSCVLFLVITKINLWKGQKANPTYEEFFWGDMNPEDEAWTALLVSPLNGSIYCFAFFLSAEEKRGRGVFNLSEISGQPWSTDVYLPSNLFKLSAQCTVCVVLLHIVSFLSASEFFLHKLPSCLKERLAR